MQFSKTLNKNFIFNSLLLVLLLFLLSGLQTSFWFQIFGSIPAPQFWQIIMVYVLLYRRSIESVFLVYLFGFVLSAFSAVPMSVWITTLCLVSLSVSYIKSRFFWPTLRYFVIASLSTSIFFNLIFWIVSHLLESNPAQSSFFVKMAEVLLTTSFSVPVYRLLSFVDRLTLEEKISHVSGRVEGASLGDYE